MTDRERYMRAFSVLRPAEGWIDRLEIGKPEKRKRPGRGLIAVLAAVLALAVLIGAAYAADLGGIQGRVRLRHLGKELDMTVKTGWSEDGAGGVPHRMYVFCNENGEELFRYPAEGTEGLKAETLMEQIQADMIGLDTRNCVLSEDNRLVLEWVNGNHSIYLHFFDRSIDIGEYFDENGFGRYEGVLWQGNYGYRVGVWRTLDEPWWQFSSHRLEEEP